MPEATTGWAGLLRELPAKCCQLRVGLRQSDVLSSQVTLAAMTAFGSDAAANQTTKNACTKTHARFPHVFTLSVLMSICSG